jgi:hypothetical protein
MEAADHHHAPTVALCRYFTTVWPEYLFGDLEACERRSAELVAYCIDKKVAQFRLYGGVMHACARARRDSTVENIEAVRAAGEANQQSGARVKDSMILSCLAEVLLATGDVTGLKQRWKTPLNLPSSPRSDCCSRRLATDRRQGGAIEVARGQEARLLKLRAAIYLARLWRDSGAPNDRRASLEPILAAIEGG